MCRCSRSRRFTPHVRPRRQRKVGNFHRDGRAIRASPKRPRRRGARYGAGMQGVQGAETRRVHLCAQIGGASVQTDCGGRSFARGASRARSGARHDTGMPGRLRQGAVKFEKKPEKLRIVAVSWLAPWSIVTVSPTLKPLLLKSNFRGADFCRGEEVAQGLEGACRRVLQHRVCDRDVPDITASAGVGNSRSRRSCRRS